VSESQVEVLYTCIICGKAWSKIQSLRAHMKVHRNEGYMRTGIQVRTERWEKFRSYCKRHKTTTCQLLDALMELTLKGEEKGVVTLGSSNPTVLQLNQYFSGIPRSKNRFEFSPPVPVGPHCLICGSRQVSETQPLDGVFREGRCLGCGATWLVSPGGQRL